MGKWKLLVKSTNAAKNWGLPDTADDNGEKTGQKYKEAG